MIANSLLSFIPESASNRGEMVKLLCAMVGAAGSAFGVEIDEGVSVSALKKAIKAVKPRTITTDEPDLLQLFLAKKGGEWQPDDDPAALQLERGEIDDARKVTTEEQLKATWTIQEVLKVNKMSAPKSRQIHVLVVVPERAGDSAIDTSVLAEISAQLVELRKDIVDLRKHAVGKRKYVHSDVTSTQGRKLLSDLDVRVEFVRTVPFATGESSSVGPYEWKSVTIENNEEVVLTEEQQRQRYRAYVERNIAGVLARKKLSVIGVEIDTNILTFEVPGREIKLAGRTDLLILSDVVKTRPSEVQYLPGVKMLIEVKREVKPSNDFQALSELIALDLMASDPVMALLTDLKGEWFFWVAEKINHSVRICKAAINKPGEAFELIKVLLEQPPPSGTGAATEIALPCFQHPVKRLKLREAWPAVGEGGGIRESIERYYDIASILGPDIEMARAVALQVTQSIPTLSYFS